MFSFKH